MKFNLIFTGQKKGVAFVLKNTWSNIIQIASEFDSLNS